MATEIRQHQLSDQLAETITAIRAGLNEATEAPAANFLVDTHLVDGFRTSVNVRQFSMTVDEPPTLGGEDNGPTPVELVLSALGTCQEIVYATYARVLGVPIDALSIRVEGVLDPRGFFGVRDVPAGFSTITYNVDIRSSAPTGEIERLVSTVNAHCPVLDILRQPTPVTGTYSLNGQSLVGDAHPADVFPA